MKKVMGNNKDTSPHKITYGTTYRHGQYTMKSVKVKGKACPVHDTRAYKVKRGTASFILTRGTK